MRVSIRPDPLALTGRGTTYILIAAWLYANISSLKWLFALFKQASPLHLLLIALIVVVLLVQVARSRRREGFESHSYLFSATPVVRSLPLLLMVGSALCAIAFQWLVDLEQFIVLLFLLGTYGLCGLFLAPSVWRKGLPIASLLACIVPFSSQVGTGLGMPARIFTAHAVEHLLSTWHVAAISSYDIILLENGVARVDIPCSGLKSLWTGTIFLLAATWLEGRKLGLRWLLVCVSNLFFLLCANTTRVLLLVVISYVLKQPLLAETLHIPLGLIGLCCACGLSWLMLQTVPRQGYWGLEIRDKQDKEASLSPHSPLSPQSLVPRACFHTSPSLSDPPKSPLKRGTLTEFSPLVVLVSPCQGGVGGWGGSGGLKTRPSSQSPVPSPASLSAKALLIAFVLVLVPINHLYHPQEEQPLSIASLHWPTQMVSERISLSAAEHKYFDNYPYLFPEKRRFVLGDLSGSILMVANTTLGTYHPPELCLLGTGFKVDRMERKRLTPTVQARWLSLGDSKLSATYWFQSPTQTTDDFLSRFWSDITRRQKNWVLVSILFDRSVRPDSSEIREFATTIHDAIDHSLKKG